MHLICILKIAFSRTRRITNRVKDAWAKLSLSCCIVGLWWFWNFMHYDRWFDLLIAEVLLDVAVITSLLPSTWSCRVKESRTMQHATFIATEKIELHETTSTLTWVFTHLQLYHHFYFQRRRHLAAATHNHNQCNRATACRGKQFPPSSSSVVPSTSPPDSWSLVITSRMARCVHDVVRNCFFSWCSPRLLSDKLTGACVQFDETSVYNWGIRRKLCLVRSRPSQLHSIKLSSQIMSFATVAWCSLVPHTISHVSWRIFSLSSWYNGTNIYNITNLHGIIHSKQKKSIGHNQWTWAMEKREERLQDYRKNQNKWFAEFTRGLWWLF